MNDSWWDVICYVVVGIIVIALCAWLTKTIWYSDLPIWLKIMLLK